MDNFVRKFSIFADGEPVAGCARAKLIGSERLGLYPSLFMLHLWNLAEEEYLASGLYPRTAGDAAFSADYQKFSEAYVLPPEE